MVVTGGVQDTFVRLSASMNMHSAIHDAVPDAVHDAMDDCDVKYPPNHWALYGCHGFGAMYDADV